MKTLTILGQSAHYCHGNNIACHDTINWMVKHSTKSVMETVAVCRAKWVTGPSSLSAQCSSRLGISSKSSVAVTPVCSSDTDTSTLKLHHSYSLKGNNSVLGSGRACHFNLLFFQTVLPRSILCLAAEKPWASEGAVIVTGKVCCKRESLFHLPQMPLLKKLFWSHVM